MSKDFFRGGQNRLPALFSGTEVRKTDFVAFPS